MGGLFDTHVHLHDDRFDGDREAIIGAMRTQGMRCVTIGADMPSSAGALALALANPDIWASVGVHPHEAKAFVPEDVEQLTRWAAEDKVVAIGEIGLDYHYDFSPREVQRTVFATQLALAHRLGMPAILHVREAHGDVLDILTACKGALPKLIVHCYSGSWESAKAYMALGAMISLAGPVTFPKAVNLHEVAKQTPLDRLLIETDCPYLAPQPVRGKRNTPLHVEHVARQIALLKGIDYDEVVAATAANAEAFFGLPKKALGN